MQAPGNEKNKFLLRTDTETSYCFHFMDEETEVQWDWVIAKPNSGQGIEPGSELKS